MRCIPAQGQRPDARGERGTRSLKEGSLPRRGGRGPILGRRARRFARDEAGAVTVEALFWIPFFFGVLMLITDVSMAFFAKAEAFRIVQNGNRLLSVRSLDTAAEVETWVEDAYSGRSASADATTAISEDETIVSTQIVIPIREVMLFNVFGATSDWVMTVNSQHYIEWPNP